MNDEKLDKLKELVRNKYSEIASRTDAGKRASCCEPTGCCGTADKNTDNIDVVVSDSYINVMAESYTGLDGYLPDADMQLGCGIPVASAGLKPGQSVLDLGSGAGNDLFVARSIVGDTGQLTGLDFSDPMIQKARSNAQKLGYDNMNFISGDIENIPLDANRFDVVLSNCVLNLVPDKKRAFSEIFRVLKPGGHFSISDIVLEGDIPESIQKTAEAYVGCVSGATQKGDYLEIVKNAGFSDVAIQSEREIIIPAEWLSQARRNQDTNDIQSDSFSVLSITLTGRKTKVIA